MIFVGFFPQFSIQIYVLKIYVRLNEYNVLSAFFKKNSKHFLLVYWKWSQPCSTLTQCFSICSRFFGNSIPLGSRSRGSYNMSLSTAISAGWALAASEEESGSIIFLQLHIREFRNSSSFLVQLRTELLGKQNLDMELQLHQIT